QGHGGSATNNEADSGQFPSNFNEHIWSFMLPQHCHPGNVPRPLGVGLRRHRLENTYLRNDMCLRSQSRRKVGKLPSMLNKDRISPQEPPSIERPPSTTPKQGVTGLHIPIECRGKDSTNSRKLRYLDSKSPLVIGASPVPPV